MKDDRLMEQRGRDEKRIKEIELEKSNNLQRTRDEERIRQIEKEKRENEERRKEEERKKKEDSGPSSSV